MTEMLNTKDHFVGLRISEDEKLCIKNRSDRLGIPMSQVVRDMVRYGIRNMSDDDYELPTKPPAAINEESIPPNPPKPKVTIQVPSEHRFHKSEPDPVRTWYEGGVLMGEYRCQGGGELMAPRKVR